MPYNYPVKFGKYLLTKRIAVGGMAELFLAKMVGIKGFEKTLALKKILPEFGEDEEFVELFVDEAKISVQLQHANIVQVFDFGEIDGSYYISMEFVDGPNLKNLLKRCLKKKGYFPFEIAIFVVMQVLKSLDYAQRVTIGEKTLINLVHRDISPQNVLISREGEVKITDFGIAKATIKLTKTQPGKIQGKFSYMSPEQASGLDIDHRSDLFSLGIIFFEMLTGYKLYSGDDTSAKYARVREAKIPAPSTYNKSIPHELETIILKMLAKKREDRYQSAGEILKELTDYLYPTSTELISTSLATLVKELFPVPMSQEKEIAMGKILEVEKERSTQTDFRLLDQKKIEKGNGEPILLDKKKIITKVSMNASGSGFKIKSIATYGFIIIVIGLLMFLLFRDCGKTSVNPIATPTQTATEKITSAPTPVETIIATPTYTATPTLKGKKTPSKKTVKPSPTPTPPPCPTDMSFIEKGPFLFGSSKNDPDRNFGEEDQKIVYLNSYCIDVYEYPNTLGALPKTGLNIFEAQTLCKQKGKRLCLETEWEKACSGKDSFKYPYGNAFSANACNTQDSSGRDREPVQIGSFDSCKSSFGVFDLSGNASEWTLPINNTDPKEKGGSGKSPGWGSRCASRRDLSPNTKDQYMGFRCCKNAVSGEKNENKNEKNP